jgi:HEPN domain-containing protein
MDWPRQAEADYTHAVHSLAAGDYEWCCFSAQQSAEKAVKAMFLKHGMVPTRYPNSFDSGAPTDLYTKGEGEDALACSKRIIEYCRHQVDESRTNR